MSIIPSLAASCGESWSGRDQLGSARISGMGGVRIPGTRTVIALWLGHESPEMTQMYLQADTALKERALARTTPMSSRPGRYRPDDKLMAFLKSL
jgi:hypothetical protein